MAAVHQIIAVKYAFWGWRKRAQLIPGYYLGHLTDIQP
jgi:hypothetical protein